MVITPRKSNSRAPTGKRSARKATPVKSPYFSSQANGDDDDDDDEDEEEESDNEVVQPRRTTARTRRSG